MKGKKVFVSEGAGADCIIRKSKLCFKAINGCRFRKTRKFQEVWK